MSSGEPGSPAGARVGRARARSPGPEMGAGFRVARSTSARCLHHHHQPAPPASPPLSLVQQPASLAPRRDRGVSLPRAGAVSWPWPRSPESTINAGLITHAGERSAPRRCWRGTWLRPHLILKTARSAQCRLFGEAVLDHPVLDSTSPPHTQRRASSLDCISLQIIYPSPSKSCWFPAPSPNRACVLCEGWDSVLFT